MKIKGIEIKNFRGIESLKLDFTDPSGNALDLVVLAGPNGCGKTSVLEACVLALGSEEMQRQCAKPESDLRIGAQNFEFFIYPWINGQEARPIHKINKWRSSIPYPDDFYEEIRLEYFSSWREPKLVGSVPVTAGKKRKKSKDSENSRLSQIKEFLINMTARKAFEQASINDENFGDPFERINKSWQYFYPYKKEEFVAKPASKTIGEGFDLFLSDESSGKQIPVDALSSGELEILTMLGWFSINDFEEGIVLIDEPELHLHPAWHRAIIRALRSVLPKTQIICATHSAEILDSAYSYERFTLLNDEDPRIRMKNVVNQ